MNLIERINEVKALEGYIYHRKRAEDHQGFVQCYTFWFQTGAILKDYEVRFLVTMLGQPEEEARCYGITHIPQPIVTYKSVVDAALNTFITNNASYEKGIVVACDEVNEVALVKAFEVTGGNAEEKWAVVYKVDGNLTIRLLLNYKGV